MESQSKAVHEYLKENGSITPMEALRQLGVMRLAARVFDLRESGVVIESETVWTKRNGKPVHFARYSL
jgi:hypothetical protein